MPSLSVTIIALNQEANIGDCLQSVSFADEIVVVDSGSADRTVELAREYTDRVITAPWQGFAGTKNFALDQARMDWVFSLDTDERVPPALRAGNPGGGPGRRTPGRLPGAPEELPGRSLDQAPGLVSRLHPAAVPPGPGPLSGAGGPRRGGSGRARGTLRTPLEHYSYNDLREYAARQDRYARLAAREMARPRPPPPPGGAVLAPVFYLLEALFPEGRVFGRRSGVCPWPSRAAATIS